MKTSNKVDLLGTPALIYKDLEEGPFKTTFIVIREERLTEIENLARNPSTF